MKHLQIIFLTTIVTLTTFLLTSFASGYNEFEPTANADCKNWNKNLVIIKSAEFGKSSQCTPNSNERFRVSFKNNSSSFVEIAVGCQRNDGTYTCGIYGLQSGEEGTHDDCDVTGKYKYDAKVWKSGENCDCPWPWK